MRRPRQTLTCPISLTIKSPSPDSTSTLTMPKTLRVGMIGYRFMGKAHSNAWRQAPHFFPLKARIEMHTICGRDRTAVDEAREQLGWENASNDWRAVVNSPEI